ncbi:MAG: diguanylate cyclase [Novosphingobium sp.]
MTAHDPQLIREQRGLLRWLGFGSTPAVTPPDAVSGAENETALDPRERRRRQLLTDIGSFVLTHQLDVSPYGLAIAHDVITGTDQRLARAIEARIAQRQPLTMDWLEETGRSSGRGESAASLDALMAKLESSLEEFSRTATNARSVTTDYSSALQAHVGELEQVSKAGVVISELASIAKVMLERTREIEQEMSRSELQTRALQSSLDEARRKADMDHLTGLPNRRAFESVLERELAAAREAGEPLCVAFCDIDYFKKVNDTHGHDAGDRVLKVVAQMLSKISDDKCHVARHGGEEFVVLFRGKTPKEAQRVLDDAREAMAERRLVNRATDVPFGKITFSGGIADVLAYSGHREALKAADDALYAAKAAGRNQIAVAGRHVQIEQAA